MNDEQKKSKKKMIKKIQKGGGLKTLKVSSNNKNKNKMEDDRIQIEDIRKKSQYKTNKKIKIQNGNNQKNSNGI